MNKSILYSLFMGMALLVACDPVETRDQMTGVITADQLNISVTPEVVDGVRSNKLILANHSPVLSFWNYGVGTSAKAYDEVLVTSVGDIEVIFTGRNGDGSTITKSITVNVESIVYEVTGMDKFIGDGAKTWFFDAFTDNNHPYGIGGVGDKAATWWGPEYGEFDEWDASMTFALDGGAIFTKTLADGSQQKGSFSFNLAKKVGDWSQGILSLKGATLPHGVSVNNPAGDAFEFYIIVLEDDQLVLSNLPGNEIADAPGGGGEANFWMFRPEGYTAFDDTELMALLTGDTEKIWTWTGGDAWGNNAVDASAPGWWVVKTADIDGQAPGEGEGAYMTFSADGKMTKHTTTGETVEGTFKFGAPFSEKWTAGTIETKDVTVLCGVAGNTEGYPDGKMPVNKYGIVELSENKLVLGFNNHTPEGDEGWYWIFKPKE
jgi:hypothetical protein